MKIKINLDWLAAIAFLFGISVYVNALDDSKFTIRRDSFGNMANNLSDYGAEMVMRPYDSAGVFISSGSGVLLDIMISTGAATEYVVCASTNIKDVALVQYITAGTMQIGSGASHLTVMPPMFANTTNAISAHQSVIGFTPTSFTNGLVCRASVGSLPFFGIKYTVNGRP